jgi:NTE family protein
MAVPKAHLPRPRVGGRALVRPAAHRHPPGKATVARSTHRRPTVAFVFQGGGSLTAAQVGMLRALLEAGITPDFVIGSSAGAMNAVTFAQDPTVEGLARLEQLWSGLRRGAVFPINARDIVAGLAGRRDGLVSPRRLRALLTTSLQVAALEDTAIPAHVVATSVLTGEPVVLSTGPTIDALLASTAIPGIFPPVRVDGDLLMDGAICADIPILQAEALGATVSYVLPAVGPVRRPGATRGALNLLMHALNHVFERTTTMSLTAARNRIHVLPNTMRHKVSPFDFRRTGLLINDGYVAARAALLSPTAALGA